MPYKADPIAEKLDRIAEATGMPQLSKKLERALPIRFRLIPLALLAAAFAGLWVQIAVSELFGYLIVMLAWMIGGAIQAFSAASNTRGKPLDEREAALVRSGHLTGLIAALGLAVLGCMFIGMGSAATLLRLGSFWAPDTPTDWFALAFFLLAVESNVAVIAASARLPEAIDEEDE